MWVENGEDEGNEGNQHVNYGDDAVHTGIWVDVGEVINGCDESIPWEDNSKAQSEVDYVSEMGWVFGYFIVGRRGHSLQCWKEESSLAVAVGSEDSSNTHVWIYS